MLFPLNARFGNQNSAVDELAAEFLVLYVNLLAEQGDDQVSSTVG